MEYLRDEEGGEGIWGRNSVSPRFVFSLFCLDLSGKVLAFEKVFYFCCLQLKEDLRPEHQSENMSYFSYEMLLYVNIFL